MAVVLAALVLGAAAPLLAQTAPSSPLTCPEMVQAALVALEDNCTGVGRNTACYANTLVESSFTQPVPDDYFSQPADRADIVTLSSMATSPMDEANDIWGIALMNVQANLPGALPGQSVTMLLMGEAIVGNAVTPADAALPIQPIEVVTNREAEVRTLPEADALVAGTTATSARLAADARTPNNLWVRVAVPAVPPYGGWVETAQLDAFDLNQLPVVDANTRTPMQAFVFRTGIGQPNCAEAPNSVIVQGPNNTQVLMNVNGADLTIGSTVRLSSVAGAPQEILDTLDLPEDVANQLNNASQQNGANCGVMAMNVLSGAVEVNDGTAILPAGNTAFAVACGQPEPESESTPEPGTAESIVTIDFTSPWGAFTPMTEEELLALAPLQEVGDTVLNYPIVLPDPNNIQPPITVTPTPTPGGFGGGFPAPTATPTPTATPMPTPNPTELPGRGLSTFLDISPAANNQIAIVTQPFAVPFSVRVTDPYGGPSIGVPVTFSAPASGPSGVFSATGTATQIVNTDQSGNAVTSAFISNAIAGGYTVTASAPQDVGFFASLTSKDVFAKPAAQSMLAGTFNVTNVPGVPSLISAAPGGTNLTATVATTYAGQPAVLITDAYSNPVPFVPVTFTAQTGGSGATGLFGASPTANSATGFDGIASAPFLTANTIAGAFQIAVTSPAGAVNLDMTNLPDVPAALTATFGGGQSATVGTAFANFLIAQVTDTYGNGVPAVNVTFTAPGSGVSAGFLGSGTNSETIASDSTGYATSSAVIANTISGGYTITATAGAFSAPYALTNTAGAPASMAITGGNGQSAVINTAFGANLSVNVVDTYGNPAAGAPVTFTAPGSGASGSFSGPNPVSTDGSGNATSPPFTANDTAGAYTVTATSGAALANFNLTNLNPVPTLTLISPASAVAGSGGFTLTVTGAGFVPGMQVTWSGQANLAATVSLPTSATVSVPAGYISLPGVATIGLVNPAPGGGLAAGTLTFTINPSTVVTTLADSGPGSLRQIITDAPPGSTITFGVSGTITLTSGAIGINKNLTISGPGAGVVSVSGNNADRIFDINGAGTTVAISGLRFTNGYGPSGLDAGAIYVHLGTIVSINTSQFDNNQASGAPCCEKGGAIFSEGALTITNSSFISNYAGQMASAVAAWPTGTSLSITNSCLLNNTGAGNYAVSSSVPTTISGNWWGNPGGPGAGGVNNSIPTDSAPASGPIGGVPGC